MYGDAGNDRVLGYGGNDWFSGGLDEDILDGGAGSDTLMGDAGGDLLTGGPAMTFSMATIHRAAMTSPWIMCTAISARA